MTVLAGGIAYREADTGAGERAEAAADYCAPSDLARLFKVCAA
jgi:hypothetical protein